MEKVFKTGTTIVGIVAKDGVVLASDKRATEYFIIASKSAQKIYQITDKIALAAAGVVADLQVLAKVLKAELTLKQLRSGKEPTAKEAANLLATILYSKRFYFTSYMVALIVAGKDNGSWNLYVLDPIGSVIEEKKYYAEGSGMMFALGVLEANYKENLTLEEAKELAKKAVYAAIKRDAGSGDGIEIVSISDKGVEREYIPIKEIIET